MTGTQRQDFQIKTGTSVVEDLPSFEGRLKTNARVISEVAELSTEEIEAAMGTLHRMVDVFKKRDELLEKLLDPTTPYAEARQIALASFSAHSRVFFRRLKEPERNTDPIQL